MVLSVFELTLVRRSKGSIATKFIRKLEWETDWKKPMEDEVNWFRCNK